MDLERKEELASIESFVTLMLDYYRNIKKEKLSYSEQIDRIIKNNDIILTDSEKEQIKQNLFQKNI